MKALGQISRFSTNTGSMPPLPLPLSIHRRTMWLISRHIKEMILINLDHLYTCMYTYIYTYTYMYIHTCTYFVGIKKLHMGTERKII